ncbi:acyl-CoA oxidase [Hesseltinella vesiculosa]|uniref:Acyl-coenzyme A oxidase n=1 Tax=Hesseltinella vesiculosa TaxID=101127 RepID=A0A1X2G3T9_9FUNG|nr:acyl-CoA oxidase [Hesseltinella vesiculosa]
MTPVRFPAHLKPHGPQGSDLLAQERQRATFDAKALTAKIYDQGELAKKKQILQVLTNDPILSDKSHRYFCGRDVRFSKAMQAAQRMAELIQKHKWTHEDVLMADLLFDEAGPFRLHRTMFMPTIEGQGTDEQKKLFLEPAQRYEIIGCYAQTELGHGSNVRGLETTATYDRLTGTFILHSPTLTASKWWIGGLGKTATHAVVMARLVINGKDLGPHTFVVQIRDLKTHEPLPGITVGDIGPKFGFSTVDNGFILFDKVRIPHISMMARFSKVDKATGDYIKPPNDKLSYGTMVFVRANIVIESRNILARAATVAIRYSSIRSQGADAANPKKMVVDGVTKIVETPVLDYMMQQYRLLPIVAQAYACHFTGKAMHRKYYENQARMAQGDFSFLADLHASSSGLKSLTTTIAVAAIEESRRACGGHGYLLASGLGQFYQDYLPKATWEGDNYLLTQQTTRYLLKTYRSIRAGKVPEKDQQTNFSVQYISDYLGNPGAKCSVATEADWTNPETLLSVFKNRVAYMIEQAVHDIDIDNRTWNDMLVEVYRISRAHCQLIMVSNFFQGVFSSDSDGLVRHALGDVALLYALTTLEQELADVLTSGFVTPAQASTLKKQVISVLKRVRPNAVALVDAFDFPDYLLNSALGSSDGYVYERLTQMAEQEPLNHTSVVHGYDDFYRPLIHAGQGNWQVDIRGVTSLCGYDIDSSSSKL